MVDHLQQLPLDGLHLGERLAARAQGPGAWDEQRDVPAGPRRQEIELLRSWVLLQGSRKAGVASGRVACPQGARSRRHRVVTIRSPGGLNGQCPRIPLRHANLSCCLSDHCAWHPTLWVKDQMAEELAVTTTNAPGRIEFGEAAPSLYAHAVHSVRAKPP